jgi:hypothetical protein
MSVPSMKKSAMALRAASTDEERITALRAITRAADAGRSVRPAAEDLLAALTHSNPDVRVCSVIALGSAGAHGFDLTPAMAGLVAALRDGFRHHAVRALIHHVHADPSHAEAVMNEIRRHPRMELLIGVEKIVSLCTSGVPAREWTWGSCGVHTRDGVLTWHTTTGGGRSADQTFDSFRRSGPRAPTSIIKDYDIPEDVYRELSEVLGAPPPYRKTRAIIEREIGEALDALRAFTPHSRPARCSLCSTLEPRRVDHLAGETWPASWGKLIEVVWTPLGTILACRECGDLDLENRLVDNEFNSCSDVSTLVPVTLADVEEKLRHLAFDLEWRWEIKRGAC